jgi:hypothetical protein
MGCAGWPLACTRAGITLTSMVWIDVGAFSVILEQLVHSNFYNAGIA